MSFGIFMAESVCELGNYHTIQFIQSELKKNVIWCSTLRCFTPACIISTQKLINTNIIGMKNVWKPKLNEQNSSFLILYAKNREKEDYTPSYLDSNTLLYC